MPAGGFLAVLFAAIAPRVEAQRGWADFTRRFDAFAEVAGVVGGSAALVRKGMIAARHHFGFADLAARRKVSDRTIYHWASVTKTLTAIAVLQLRDRGLLTLDDRITRWVPELREIHDPDGIPPGPGRAASHGSRSSPRHGASWWR